MSRCLYSLNQWALGGAGLDLRSSSCKQASPQVCCGTSESREAAHGFNRTGKVQLHQNSRGFSESRLRTEQHMGISLYVKSYQLNNIDSGSSSGKRAVKCAVGPTALVDRRNRCFHMWWKNLFVMCPLVYHSKHIMLPFHHGWPLDHWSLWTKGCICCLVLDTGDLDWLNVLECLYIDHRPLSCLPSLWSEAWNESLFLRVAWDGTSQ